MNIKNARIRAGLTQQKMSDIFEIPKRTIENWESGTNKCPGYVEKLILEKLEGIIMMNAKEVLKKANEINVFGRELPQVKVGDIITLGDVWDGDGDVPEDSYSYLLTHDGEDGESNIDVNINYVFEFLNNSIVDLINNLDGHSSNYHEDKRKIIDAEIEIVDIELC